MAWLCLCHMICLNIVTVNKKPTSCLECWCKYSFCLSSLLIIGIWISTYIWCLFVCSSSSYLIRGIPYTCLSCLKIPRKEFVMGFQKLYKKDTLPCSPRQYKHDRITKNILGQFLKALKYVFCCQVCFDTYKDTEIHKDDIQLLNMEKQ